MIGWILSGLTAIRALGMRVGLRGDVRIHGPRARRRRSVVSAGPEPLLCFGLLMAAGNGPVSSSLLREPSEGATPLVDELAECWGIRDARTARSTLQGMLLEAHGQQLDGDFKRLQRNESSAFDGEQRLRWQRAKQAWLKAGLVLPGELSMAAHEYECIAWLARRCHACGYLTEAEAWLALAWVAEAAIRTFADWQAYAASFVLGQATLLRDGQQTALAIRAFKELVGSGKGAEASAGLWQKYPLAGIRVAEVVLQWEHVIEMTGLPSRQTLLAFGALIATSGGARADTLALAPHEHELNRLWLAEHWRATDRDQVVQRLDWLLNDGSRGKLDAMLERFGGAAGDPEQAAGPVVRRVRFDQARRALLKAGHDPESIDECRTLLAYDLERAAFGARLAYSAGLLDEDHLWNALRHMARQARAAFDCWEQYLISVSLGHALANEDWEAGKRLIRSGMELLDGITPFAEFPSPWQACPLALLPILHPVAPVACRAPGDSYRT
ncbi:MAG: hypothetical protein CTR55_21105 [Pseudomonas sp.]|uniref:DUF1266 domain-containing protein n=1 Tax=Pseudomonas sp. TaxID=306 RepID=UPI000CC689C5|nr:DUF1266 domain-containing protein [Pseudomonas sp.]PJI47039.1 MAG: hypothetical protein CTR55_21105 [Pseudomonas sp.]